MRLTIEGDFGDHGRLKRVRSNLDRKLEVDGDSLGDGRRDHVLDGDRLLARVQHQELQRSRLAVGGQQPKVDQLLGAVNSGL